MQDSKKLKVESLTTVSGLVTVTSKVDLPISAIRQSKSVCGGGRRQPQYGLTPQFKADKTRL